MCVSVSKKRKKKKRGICDILQERTLMLGTSLPTWDTRLMEIMFLTETRKAMQSSVPQNLNSYPVIYRHEAFKITFTYTLHFLNAVIYTKSFTLYIQGVCYRIQGACFPFYKFHNVIPTKFAFMVLKYSYRVWHWFYMDIFSFSKEWVS